eukprot:12055361-Ditylum_brightwellii.AAC.1
MMMIALQCGTNAVPIPFERLQKVILSATADKSLLLLSAASDTTSEMEGTSEVKVGDKVPSVNMMEVIQEGGKPMK